MLSAEEENFAAMESMGLHRPQTMREILTQVAEEQEPDTRSIASRLIPRMKFGAGQFPAGGVTQAALGAYLAGEIDHPILAETVRRYDAQFSVLRNRPTGPSPQEFSARALYDGAIQRGRRAQQEFDRTSTSTAGDFGIFVGGMIGAMDPETSPLVAVTLPIGGFGRNVVRRMASEAAMQAGIETGLMFGGQFRGRRRFNSNFGVMQAATEVLAAAALGGTFQGLIEGGVAVGRRVFRSTPADPGPTPDQVVAATEPPPPVRTAQDIRVVNILEDFDTFMEVMSAERAYGASRLGASRMRDDLDFVDQQLASFDGVRPSEVKPFRGFEAPQTATRIPESVEGVNFGKTFERATQRIETVDELALRADPVAIGRFNKLKDQRNRLRALLKAQQARDAASPPPETRLPEVEEQISRQIADVETRLARAKGKQAERLADDFSELTRQRERVRAEITRTDIPSVAEIREQIIRVDERMRDLAPLVSRAYAAARNEWADIPDPAEVLAQLDELLGRGAPSEGVGPIRVEVPTRVVADNTGPPVTGAPDAPATGPTARPHNSEQIDQADQVLREQTDAELASIEAQAAESDGFEIGGQRIELDEPIILPTEDGGSRTITVRQLLAESAEDAEIMQAVSTCRIS